MLRTTTKPLGRDQRAEAERVLKWASSFGHAAERLLTEHPGIRSEFPDLVKAIDAVEVDLRKIRHRLIEMMRRSE